MSSQPPEPEAGTPDPEAAPPKRPTWYSYWPPWRRIMLTGALILLASSVISAVFKEDAPDWLPNLSLIVGYGFLAWGFLKAMRARSEARSDETRWTEQTKDGWEGPAGTNPDDQEKS